MNWVQTPPFEDLPFHKLVQPPLQAEIKINELNHFLLFRNFIVILFHFPLYNIEHRNVTYITNLNHEAHHFLQKSTSSPALYKYSWPAYPENKLIFFNAVKFMRSN